MSSDRRLAVIASVLFIVGFAGVLSAVLEVPILGDPDYLTRISTNETRLVVGALFQFIMAAACAGIGVSLYPVLRRYSEGLALGAVAFRTIEAVFQIVCIIILLVLLTLSQEFVEAGAPNSSSFQIVGALLLAGNDWVNNVAVLLAWCLGALMYYYVFYRWRLIPRWLSGWGLFAATLAIAGVLLIMFYLIGSSGAIQPALNAPIALQEIVLAVWLIAKGFDTSASASGSDQRIQTRAPELIRGNP